MIRPAIVPAKLSRPHLHHAVARENLFSKIDHSRAVCVLGPPGAGKTTLVASWCDARKIKGIWFQVDPGDADPATFFYYLGEASRPFARKGQRALPKLTPEYLQDIPGFARRFFRELFARLPAGASLVLDNYHEVPGEAVFHQIIADAVAEVPTSARLVVISRRDPPNCYIRLIANDSITFIDWHDLRLSVDETRAIVSARGTFTPAEVERLHRESDGWAAGLTLMLEGLRRSEQAIPDQMIERELLFDYFAAQIFAQVPEATRRFLMITALLPQVPVSVARDLTDEPEAATILEHLYQRHLFTHRKPGSELTYWYHALFRGFLLSQADRLLDEAERRRLERRAARLLETRNLLDDAFLLFHASLEWDAIVRLAERHAADLLAKGRGQTLREWISALPAELISDNPWLRYWLGTSLIPINQSQAREQLAAAYALFASGDNGAGKALAAAGVLDTYYFEWSDFAPMKAWVERLEASINEHLFAEAPLRELSINASLLIGILYGVPGHHSLDRCVKRVFAMLDENLDSNSKLKAATYLLTYCNLSGSLALGESVIARALPLLESSEITPLNELWWFLRLAHFHTMVADLSSARQDLNRVREVANAHGLTGLGSAALLTRSYEMDVSAMQYDLHTTQRLLTETEALAATHGRPMDLFHLMDGRAYVAMLRRDAQGVCKWAGAALAAARVEAMRYTEVLALARQAHGQVELDMRDELMDSVREIRELIAGTYMSYVECEIRLLLAYAALRSGINARDLIESALRHAREQQFHFPDMLRFSYVFTKIVAAALEAQIEHEYVCNLIAKYRLRPPAPDVAAWPWPIKLFTLGRFALEIGGTPLQFSGKTPRKPLALLKAIVAFGASDVPQGKLVDALWPGDDGDAGKHALGVTLVRLRRLLSVPDAIRVADERVSLNPELCWVDAQAFEMKLRYSEALRSAGDSENGLARQQEALRWYLGVFLPMDTDEPWSVQPRLRLRGLFVDAIENLAAVYELRREYELAIECYRRGLQADDLIEAFYLGLMRCYGALGRRAEGIAVFRRLRQVLSVVLGVPPSKESEAAAHALRLGGHVEAD